MNKNLIIGLVLVLVLGASAYFYTNRSNPASDSMESPAMSSNPGQDGNDMVVSSDSMQSAQDTKGDNKDGFQADIGANASAGTQAKMDEKQKVFTVTGSNFKFEPASLTVKKGDKVKIVFKNTGGFHDFKIDEFKVATKQIQGGSEETVEFIANKAGSFEYYCSVGKHRQMGMKGTLVVTE